MGPSGSGKTTLLDVLAGRKTGGRVEGSVLFSSVKASSMFLRRYTGYVEQCGARADPKTPNANNPDTLPCQRRRLLLRALHLSPSHHGRTGDWSCVRQPLLSLRRHGAMKKIKIFCMQCADTLVDVLTVEEMLMYTAELKRPLRESTASKRAAVDALIQDLNLGGCRSTRIGNSMHRGISGGQVQSPC